MLLDPDLQKPFGFTRGDRAALGHTGWIVASLDPDFSSHL
jgi:hypothetical protein